MITLIAPYSRGEVTAAAIRLADLATASGQDVLYFSRDKIIRGVHPQWDRLVRRFDPLQHSKKLSACNLCVSFRPDPDAQEALRMVAKGSRHVLVPSWHQLSPEEWNGAKDYDLIVAPSRQCFNLLREFLDDEQQVSWCHWDSGLAPVTRLPAQRAQHTKVCVIADASTIDFCGAAVALFISELFRNVEHVHVTLLSYKSWSRKDRNWLTAIQAEYGTRFEWHRNTDYLDTLSRLHACDWAIVPSVQSPFGLHVLRALSCGLPVVAYDLPPWNEFISNNVNGLLVRCESTANWFGAPSAIPSVVSLLDVCLPAFSQQSTLNQLRKQSWKLEQLQWTFTSFWTKLFEAEN